MHAVECKAELVLQLCLHVNFTLCRRPFVRLAMHGREVCMLTRVSVNVSSKNNMCICICLTSEIMLPDCKRTVPGQVLTWHLHGLQSHLESATSLENTFIKHSPMTHVQAIRCDGGACSEIDGSHNRTCILRFPLM